MESSLFWGRSQRTREVLDGFGRAAGAEVEPSELERRPRRPPGALGEAFKKAPSLATVAQSLPTPSMTIDPLCTGASTNVS